MKTRRELKQAYKETPPPMGVLVVRNKATSRFQVQAARNLPGLMNRIRFELAHTTGPSRSELMEDFRALGPEGFEVAILDVLEPKDEPGWDPASDLEELAAMWKARLLEQGGTPY